MRVLIIPEDPTLDQHVIRPIITRIFQDLGRKARIDVLTDPHLRGVDQALDRDMNSGIIEDHKMIDLFLLVVDRDCDRKKNTSRAEERQAEHPALIATLARQEIEVWALAPHRKSLDVRWEEVTADCDPKENYFDPLIKAKAWTETVGKGRKKAMRGLNQSWKSVLQACPEIQGLKDHIRLWMDRSPLGAR